MGFKSGKGKVLVLSNKTFKKLNVKFEDLTPGSHQKVYVECERCKEIFLRERRKLHQFHSCPVHITRDDGTKLKWCNHCESFLAYQNFHKNKARADNLSSWCSACAKTTETYKKANKKKILARATFDGWLGNYLASKKSNCKKSGVVFSLTFEELKDLWGKQSGRCYYSKVKLSYGKRKLRATNLDRVNPSNGYTLSNVVWCSHAMNNMKNNYSQKELAGFLQDIIFTNIRLECQKVHKDAKLPFRKRTTDAGNDLASVIDLIIPPGQVVNVATGLKISPPEGWYLTLDGRSSLFKEGIVPFRGIIDSNYTGDLFVSLYNSSDKSFKINVGDRIAQITIHKTHDVDFVEVKEFSPEYSLSRGDAGWGSSGRQ